MPPPPQRRRRERGKKKTTRRRSAPAGARRTPASIAKSGFGIAKLHPEQRSAMEAVLAGRDVLAVLPTGFGKSLIYQVPALLRDRPTVVISPLLALMRDQYAKPTLNERQARRVTSRNNRWNRMPSIGARA